MAEVLRSLRQEHVEMVGLLELLERQLDRLDAGAEPDYEVIRSVLDYCLSYPTLRHHPKEDLIFAEVRRIDAAAAEAMGDLVAAHEELDAKTRGFLAIVHQALRGAPTPGRWLGKAGRDFLDHYRAHIEMEERAFLPLAERLLSPEDWARLDGLLGGSDDPVFGDRVGRGFDALRQQIREAARGKPPKSDSGC